MQDIRDEIAHCIGMLEGPVTLTVVNDVIDRLTKVVADMTPRPVDIPTAATQSNVVNHRLAVLERNLDIVYHRLEETASALRDVVANPNLHPSVKLIADTIAVNLSNPPTDEEETR